MNTPCSKCPWRAEFKGDYDYLRPGRRAEIMHSLLEGALFPCHQTTTLDEDEDEYIRTGNESECAGADLVLLRADASGQMLRIRERIGDLDSPALLEANADLELWTMREALDELIDPDEEGEGCTVCGPACLYPAGWMVGGEVVQNDEFCEDICPGCGVPVCEECMGDECHECYEPEPRRAAIERRRPKGPTEQPTRRQKVRKP